MSAGYHKTLKDGGHCPLTVCVPFTREWCVRPFFAALYASDVPRSGTRLIVYVDSDSERLAAAVEKRALSGGWRSVVLHVSGWGPPGEKDRALIRRRRHSAMRLALRGLLPKTGPLLMLEDDTIVPRDVYARLSSTLAGCGIASGVQVGRWNQRIFGVFSIRVEDGWAIRTSLSSRGYSYPDACGLYCMLCDAEEYRKLDFRTWHEELGQDVTATWRYTRDGGRIAVDWGCGCGHLTKDGVIAPKTKQTAEKRNIMPLTIMTPSGPFWPKPPRKEIDMEGTYVLHRRVTRNGRVVAGKGKRVPMAEAVAYVREGLYCDPALRVSPLETPVADVSLAERNDTTQPDFGLRQFEHHEAAVEIKEDEGPPWVCECGKTYQTLKGYTAHREKKH